VADPPRHQTDTGVERDQGQRAGRRAVREIDGPICVACGTEFPPGAPPPACPICEDERQFVPPEGQRWTRLAELADGYRVDWTELAPGLHQLVVAPHFAIGQRALLIETAEGNILWDLVALLDEATRARIAGMGGLAAIAISHPHYYTTNRVWAEAFDAPVFLHADDAVWVQRPHARLRHWRGETMLLGPGLTLIRGGGHFEGGTMLHREEGAGTLFSGDILQVTPDGMVSVMRSYPNLIPVDAPTVRRVAAAVEPFAFDAIHGGFVGRTIATGAKAAVARSVARYLHAIGAES
jgi:hypothetical protein